MASAAEAPRARDRGEMTRCERLQSRSDFYWGPPDRVQWDWAARHANVPTMVFGPGLGYDTPYRFRVWVAPVDAVLDEEWLELVQVRRVFERVDPQSFTRGEFFKQL